MVPRGVYFKGGKAIGTHPPKDYDDFVVINLPTDHYDFVGSIKLAGKTKEEILAEVKLLSLPKDSDIEGALLNAYRRFGRVRIPLPALVSYAMRELGTSMDDHLDHFWLIHKFLRAHWGNKGLFSRRRGLEGGIKVRSHVKL